MKEASTGLAVCTTRVSGKLAGVLQDEEGRLITVPVSRLAEVGLPTGARFGYAYTDLRSWEQVDARPYFAAFGVHPRQSHHVVWTFEDAGRRLFVPALALMRNLFRPHREFFVRLFSAQGLDGVCVYTGKELIRSVHWSRPWGQSVHNALLWMSCFPSARRMADSAYVHIGSGSIGVSLPLARTRLRYRGLLLGSDFFITSVTLLQVDVLEAPFDFAEAPTSSFALGQSKYVARMPGKERLVALRLPLRPDGRWEATDDEWTQLESTLCWKGQARRYPARDMLNAVLEKWCTGKPWRQISCAYGDFVTASRQYVTWQNNGKWSRVCEVIRTREAAAAHKPSYRPLSDDEWLVVSQALPTLHTRRKHSIRQVTDIVLRRLCTGESWNLGTVGKRGIQHAAVFQNLRWREAGVLPSLIASFKLARGLTDSDLPGLDATLNSPKKPKVL